MKLKRGTQHKKWKRTIKTVPGMFSRDGRWFGREAQPIFKWP